MLHVINLSDKQLFENCVDRLQKALADVLSFDTNKRGKLREIVAKQLGFEGYQSYLGSLNKQEYSIVPSLFNMPYFDETQEQTQVIVWYMTPEFFRDGIFYLSFTDESKEGFQETISKIKPHETHRPVAQFHIRSELHGTELNVAEQVFVWMQGECWSRNGEARSIIQNLGLKHTSMSCGDMVQIGERYFVCQGAGFKEIAF